MQINFILGLIFFKNAIIKAFPSCPPYQEQKPDAGHSLSLTELQYIRANIVQAYVSCTPSHRKLIFPCFSKLIQEDFLKSWPELLPQLFHPLQSVSDVHYLMGIIDILRIAIDAENTSSKIQNHPIFLTGFPLLLGIVSRTLGGTMKDDSFLLLKTILKAFFNAIQVGDLISLNCRLVCVA